MRRTSFPVFSPGVLYAGLQIYDYLLALFSSLMLIGLTSQIMKIYIKVWWLLTAIDIGLAQPVGVIEDSPFDDQ